MLTYVDDNLFASPAQVLVNTVNTVGIMGKGLAREFKAAYPDMFRQYAALCDRGELTIGKLLLYRTPYKWVLNFPTKRHWKQKSRLEDIEAGLKVFVARYEEFGITSVAFPQLGCGNGQLDWESQVGPVMETYLQHLPINVSVHVYREHAPVPDVNDSTLLRTRLQSDSVTPPFVEVWHDLVTSVQRDKNCGWDVVRDDGFDPAAIRWANDGQVVDRAELFDLWHRLRTFGYLATHDVPDLTVTAASALIALFERLPYIEPSRFLIAQDLAPATGQESVFSRLGDTPPGVRLSPLVNVATPASANADATVSDGAEPSRESETTRQLQLLSTS